MYIPVLRNRQVEMKVLSQILQNELPGDFFPMIEVIQERPQVNSRKDYFEQILSIFKNYSNSFFLTFPHPKKIPTSTKQPIKDFLMKTKNEDFVFNEYSRFSVMKNVIPVLSYMEGSFSFDEEKVNSDISRLRNMNFSSIGIRLTPDQADFFENLEAISIGPKDYFILDIDHKSYTDQLLKKHFISINAAAEVKNFKKVVIHCNRPNKLANNKLENNRPITAINNQLLKDYNNLEYCFDGFGDYAGLSNEFPTDGGTVSPAAVYYYTNDNVFIGYRNEHGERNINDYGRFIVPEILRSMYWKAYNDNHHANCPGCKTITDFSLHPDKARNAPAWKGITMLHYIFSLKELLG